MVSKVALLLAVLVCSQYLAQGVYVVSKAEWGGRGAKWTVGLGNYLSYAIIHHTAGSYCETRAQCNAVLQGVQPTISERTSNSVTAIHRVTMELRKVRIINS